MYKLCSSTGKTQFAAAAAAADVVCLLHVSAAAAADAAVSLLHVFAADADAAAECLLHVSAAVAAECLLPMAAAVAAAVAAAAAAVCLLRVSASAAAVCLLYHPLPPLRSQPPSSSYVCHLDRSPSLLLPQPPTSCGAPSPCHRITTTHPPPSPAHLSFYP